MDNNIQLLVFGLDDPQNIKRVILGEKVGTIVK
jgi:uridylate kinase